MNSCISDNSLLSKRIDLCEGIKMIKNKVMSFRRAAAPVNESLCDEEKQLLQKIENGFKNEEFKMYLQFIVDSKTQKITSAEALSRWESSTGEIIPPMQYIGVLEKCGLISRLDYYMFEMACRKLDKWKNTALGHVTISCNFTRLTISEKDFADQINEIADKYDFDRKNLIIEITEDSMEKNLDVAMANIRKVKELGFRIALDDIGCGYTSLINLCEYPIDVMKIDRELLLMTGKERGRKLFFGIVSLAHYLGLEVVCEGVETEEQSLLAAESSCDYIQGWYYAKALSEMMAEHFFHEYSAKI